MSRYWKLQLQYNTYKIELVNSMFNITGRTDIKGITFLISIDIEDLYNKAFLLCVNNKNIIKLIHLC